MCDTDLPISDVIAAVGYENNSYFHRVFKERYHVTPRAFRLENKKATRCVYKKSKKFIICSKKFLN